jgi:DNA-binding NarL/FixJ family response regulator
MTSIRVLLAEDHTLVRAGIRSLINSFHDIEVVAEAGDGREATRLARTVHPDIILMDISMPGLNGLEATARITRGDSHCRVLILSMHTNEEYAAQALRSGAKGYLVKEAAASELEEALHAVARGESYVSSSLSIETVQRLLEETPQSSGLDHLTPRQREILQLIAEGKSTREIAAVLSLSAKTVETHRSQLMDRLKIFDVPGLVRLAIREGLVSSDL